MEKDLKEEAKEKVEEVKDKVEEKVADAKEEVKDFKQVKTKKKRSLLKFLIFLLILVLILVGTVFGLVKANIIKKEYIPVFFKLGSYKKLEKAYLKELNSDNKNSEISGKINVEGLSGEAKEYADKFIETFNNSTIKINTKKESNDEYNLGLGLNSYNEDVLKLVANIKGDKALVSENAILEKTIGTQNEEIKEVLNQVTENEKNLKEISEKVIKLVNSSYKIKFELGNIFVLKSLGNKKEIAMNKNMNVEKLNDSLKVIAGELKKDKQKEILKDIIKTMAKMEDSKMEDKEADEEVEEAIKSLETGIEKDSEEAIKILKKQKVEITLNNEGIESLNLILDIKYKNEMFSQEELKLKGNILFKNNNEKNDAEYKKLKEAKDVKYIQSEEDLEKLAKELDLNKIVEKIEKLKVVEKLGLKEQVSGLKEYINNELMEEPKEEKNNDWQDKWNPNSENKKESSDLKPQEKEEIKKDFLEELEKKYEK